MSEIHSNIAELIIKYFESESLTDAEAAVLWEWLGSNEANRELLFESKYMLHNMKGEAEIDVAKRYGELMRRIAASATPATPALPSTPAPSARPLRRLFGRRAAVYAASIILAVTLGSGIAWYLLRQPVSEPVYAQISSGPGDMSEIVLPDGTRIVLKPSSSISYPTSFREKERRVSLRGEAFLDVAKDAERPFIIESERQEVRVLGTSLNIMAYPGQDIHQVTLLEGSVELSVYDGNGNLSDSFLMVPNRRATFDLATCSVDMDVLSAGEAARDWTDNVYRFEKEPLADIVKRLEHYYGVNIEITNAEAGSVLYSGSLSLDTNIEDALSRFEALSGFRIGKE